MEIADGKYFHKHPFQIYQNYLDTICISKTILTRWKYGAMSWMILQPALHRKFEEFCSPHRVVLLRNGLLP